MLASGRIPREIRESPEAEVSELTRMFEEMGMSRGTAERAAREVHRDDERAVRVHISHELGLDPRGAPSPVVAAVFTATTWWWGALRQLLFGALAAGATYVVGSLLGVGLT